MHIIATLFMLIVSLLLSTPAFCLDYYVNGATGTDSATCGQQPTTPCKTIKKALDNIPDGQVTIKIARGTYVEEDSFISSHSDPRNIVIEGGWEGNFTSHACVPSDTKIIPFYHNDQFVHLLFDALSYGANNSLIVTIKCVELKKTEPGDLVRAIWIRSKNNGHLTVHVDHVLITGFQQHDSGISLQSENSYIQTTISNSIIRENSTEDLIDVVAMQSSDLITLSMDKNLITNNGKSDESFVALGIYSREGGTVNIYLNNNIITDNHSLYHDAVMLVLSTKLSTISLSSINDTITNNSSFNGGSVIRIVADESGNANITMTNSILKNNGDTDISFQQGSSQNPDDGTITFSADYCILGNHEIQFGQPLYTSTNEVNADPGLKADYHLTSGSPAKDSGICGYLTGSGPYQYHRVAPYDDIDGDKRPGWGRLMGCDIGADEYRFPWVLFNPGTRGKRTP